MIIKSEMVKSHLRTVESAARAIEPRCFVSAKPRRCSAQIPVRLMASSSVKNFWLDLIRTMVWPLGSQMLTSDYALPCSATIVVPYQAYRTADTAFRAISPEIRPPFSFVVQGVANKSAVGIFLCVP